MGRGAGWTATTEARLKAYLAEGLGTAAIAKKHGWHMVSAQRAIRKDSFCEQLLLRVKLGKARVLAKSRSGIDVQSIVFTDRREVLPSRAG